MTECAYRVGVRCSIGLHDGRPTDADCDACSHYVGQDRGLGDKVHRLAVSIGADRVAKKIKNATGKDCGCGRRRAALNRLLPSKES